MSYWSSCGSSSDRWIFMLWNIYHTTNAEKDFGMILKMAHPISTGSSQGQKSIAKFVSQAPSKTLIIPTKELVQITAKGVVVTRDGFTSDVQHVKKEIMIDSSISQSRHVEGLGSI